MLSHLVLGFIPLKTFSKEIPRLSGVCPVLCPPLVAKRMQSKSSFYYVIARVRRTFVILEQYILNLANSLANTALYSTPPRDTSGTMRCRLGYILLSFHRNFPFLVRAAKVTFRFNGRMLT